MKKRYTIANKKRFVTAIALIVIIISMVFSLSRNNKVYSSRYEDNYEKVKIIDGDTLWDIAITYMPEGYDVRKMVFEIIQSNDIEGAKIYPGQLIKVPIK